MKNVLLGSAGALFAAGVGCMVTACVLPIGHRLTVPLLLASVPVAACGAAPLVVASTLRGEA